MNILKRFMLKIKYKTLEHGKRLPHINYQTSGSSGLDLYSANVSDILLEPLERISIPTGICMSIPIGYEGQIRPRSGLFIKNGINANFGTIDSDYRGEICVLIINLSKVSFNLQRGMRIAQIVFNKIELVKLEASIELDDTQRGKKGFGSTGTR